MVDREVRVTTEAGETTFQFYRMTGEETLSRPFQYKLLLLSERDDIALNSLLGTKAAVHLTLAEGSERHFHGIVADAAYLGTDGTFGRYSFTLLPWLWLLSRRNDCRIFQEQAVPDIVKAVFANYRDATFEDRLTESYSPRTYCVQYRESDFDFVSRLLEDEGIYYYFLHDSGGHRMQLVDSPGSHGSLSGYDKVPYFSPEEHARRQRDHIDDWHALARIRTGRTSLRSFDFEKPKADLTSNDADVGKYSHADAEVYDYPGTFLTLSEGDTSARIRLEELQSDQFRAQGGGNVAGLYAGCKFDLTDYPRKDQNTSYLVTSIQHELTSDSYRSNVADSSEEVYRCRFEVLNISIPFRPERVTPWPTISGPQTAIVTGPAGEEIYTDKYGRVKVQFHWDRLGKRDQKSSCWIRVSQLWAGTSFGGIHIPRIGQEVIVDFLEGDPDRPIITGRVYNALAMPPYGLPSNMTQSGIKSNSTKGGGGSNELMFEDKKGDELVYLHAQKNETIVVENDKSETVGHDETIKIGNDRTETVGHDETMSVGNNRTRNVAVNETVTIGSNQTVTVQANRVDTVVLNEARTVGIAQQQTVGATRNVTVGATQAHEIGINDSWTVGANRSADIGRDDSLTVGSNRSAEIGKDDEISVGKNRTITVGKVLLVQAGDEITLKTGSATIIMKKNGDITIKGKNILIDGSGKIDVKASGNITQKGQKILQN